MAYVCPCGDELTVHKAEKNLVLYCQSCGRESTAPFGPHDKKPAQEVISLTRASILKKLNAKAKAVSQEKKPKQLRDRQNYMPRR